MSRRRTPPTTIDAARRARFEAVFREVYQPLQAYARRRADAAAADDVVADAMLVIWRRLDELPSGSALPWSYAVARRCLANQRRGEHRSAALVDRLHAQRLHPVAGPGDAVDAVDEQLAAALAQLDADDREIVRLWAWEQLPPREMAVVLDISANAAAIRVHRAKQRLAQALQRKDAAAGGHTGVGSAKEAT
ncbi:MAG: sigma-70 family RNA polymerase sigma factor [Actinomycetota bacterium]|nr:sigma-70 family RNA polymerase sigma factor [Actinomycetota bacterium]